MADETQPPSSSFDDQPTVLPGSGSGDKPTLNSDGYPAIENYEIVDELGRGGMGVVYKAHDTKLDRNVAIKMILGGKFATKEEIQRFRAEGEAAARLDHSGIVPIYETGEVDGNHFFAMKFVDGSTLLDKLDQLQSDRKATCELIAKVCDAVQHAHQRAVLHRDLKPANILVDENGQPSITDFGLAKRIDGDSALTQTGLVMGSPGFMSPEQAAGQKDITTAADVFSLGAILFWAITGQPPFTGETGMQAVMKTIEGDVPSIREFAPNANSDLDLICQKAMNKDPLDRYSSAGAMAEDLRAWIDGEVLSVRRASAVSTASVWIRKNVRTAASVCFAGLLCGLLVGAIIALGELRSAAAVESVNLGLSESSRTWVSHFLFLRGLSGAWSLVQFLIVPAVAVSAFLCVLLVKPKTREVNYASSLASGIIATVVVLMLCGGWGILGDMSISRGSRDIELLSNAMWLESDAERKLLQEAALKKYPGLEDKSPGMRQALVTQKIMHEQRAGLTPGLWMGALVSVLFVGIPMTLTSILSGSLWQQGIRGWQWFGCTWERSAYLLIFFLVIAIWLRPIRPATWIMLLSLFLLLVALYQAVRMWSWIWRIAMIPVPFVCMWMSQADYQAMVGSIRNAGRATNEAELREQLLLGERRLKHNEHRYSRFSEAIGWLHLGDEAKYQFHCEKLISSFDFAYQPELADQLAKACLLRPDLQREEGLAFAHEYAAFASAFESSANYRWFYLTRALSELRKGNLDEAHKWNLKSRDGQAETGNGYQHAISHAIDSLASIGLGDLVKARQSLELGIAIMNRSYDKEMKDEIDGGWQNRLTFEILQREIEMKLQG